MPKTQLDNVHLLVHDIGNTCWFIYGCTEQQSYQIHYCTNSMLDVEHFVKPLPMRPFEKSVLGVVALAMLSSITFPLDVERAGVVNSAVISHDEMAVYTYLLKRQDRGKAFLKIMRKFEKTKQVTEDCYRGWQNPAYSVQLIWGDKDSFLPYEDKGTEFEKARPGVPVTTVQSKHFLQEEAYETIAAKIKELVSNV